MGGVRQYSGRILIWWAWPVLVGGADRHPGAVAVSPALLRPARPVTSVWCVVPQLPEPLISFRFYHELVGLAKDSIKAEAEAKAASRGRQDGSESEAATVAMVGRLRELMRDLPAENRATLLYLLRHLRR